MFGEHQHNFTMYTQYTYSHTHNTWIPCAYQTRNSLRDTKSYCIHWLLPLNGDEGNFYRSGKVVLENYFRSCSNCSSLSLSLISREIIDWILAFGQNQSFAKQWRTLQSASLRFNLLSFLSKIASDSCFSHIPMHVLYTHARANGSYTVANCDVSVIVYT